MNGIDNRTWGSKSGEKLTEKMTPVCIEENEEPTTKKEIEPEQTIVLSNANPTCKRCSRYLPLRECAALSKDRCTHPMPLEAD